MSNVSPNHAAVHFIVKQQRTTGAMLVHSTSLKCDARLAQLLSRILTTYNERLAHQTGVFNSTGVSNPFKASLSDFLQDRDFFKFTRIAADHLRLVMDGITLASGGYILFVHYTTGGRDFLLCVKLTEVDGHLFDLTQGEVTIKPHLATENLQQAARVNLDGFTTGAGQYLNLVSKRSDRDASGYFENFLGFTSEHNPAAQTSKLVTVIRDFCKAQQLDEETANDVQMTAHTHLTSLAKQQQPLSLVTLASVVAPSDPPAFTAFVNGHSDPPSDGFLPRPRELKHLIKIHIKLNGFNLSMTREFKEQHDVRVDGHGSLVIANVPSSVRDELA